MRPAFWIGAFVALTCYGIYVYFRPPRLTPCSDEAVRNAVRIANRDVPLE